MPTTVAELDAAVFLEWAKTSEDFGFATLGVLDRLVYRNYEPLVALAAAAAVTRRIELAASVLIAPYRRDVALLAKQAATVDVLSGGRLTVGVSAGLRTDDFTANDAEFSDRGKRLDAMIERCRRIWAGDEDDAIGPHPAAGRPALMIGGNSQAALRRVAKYGDGWVAGAGSVAQYSAALATTRELWRAHGRTGEPRSQAVVFYALGDGAEQTAAAHLRRYYAFLGPHAEVMARKAVTGATQLSETVAAYREAGCDEMLLFPCSGDPRQLDLLAKAVF
nr:LLM class flavin-dependent oxidoreductase [Kibdelosporangium phytohabitans]